MQAVIVIHGMGEQVPMETLNGFVDAVWTTDEGLTDRGKPNPNTGESRADGPVENVAWYKPSDASESFELRRITTEGFNKIPRTDFYEFYWAHHINGMKIADVLSWIKYLLFRNPFKSVPKDVLFTWCLLWAITIGFAGAALYSALVAIYRPDLSNGVPPALIVSILTLVAGSALFAMRQFISKKLVTHFGDVIRYVRPYPPNIAARQKIRDEGVKLLENVLNAKSGRKNRYDRVIVVSHSLGTIVAYDILTHAFSRFNTKYGVKKDVPPALEPARAALEKMIADDNFSIDDYQAQQKKTRAELTAQGNPWRVTDFITLGSPLTHAEFLLDDNMEGIRKAQANRTFPTCPPVMEFEQTTDKMRFSYFGGPQNINGRYLKSLTGTHEENTAKAREDEAPRTPHHAALFAYTRWSNLYSPSKFTLWGDQVSGPLAATFGKGIRDIQVMPGLDANGVPLGAGKSPLLAHVRYWSFGKKGRTQDPAPHHIQELRKVLNLPE